MGVSFYLAYSHYQVFIDIGYQSFCAISKAINCDTVSQSKYAVVFNVPVAVWGIWGYGFLLAVLLISVDIKNNRIHNTSLLFVIALVYSVSSLCLGIISSVFIQAYCLMCIVSWGVNFALFFFFWLFRRRYKETGFRLKHITRLGSAVFVFAAVAVALIMVYPRYWIFSLSDTDIKLNTGITSEGFPWIGAQNPELTIIEFSDYRCFQCKKMHFFLRNLIAEYPEKIRLVHRHFPMDHNYNPMVKGPFHQGSGIFALVAIASMQFDRFWEANDYLYHYDFSQGAIYLRYIAADLDMDLNQLKKNMYKPETRTKLTRDIIFGIQKGFEGTPTYMIGDDFYTGQLPPDLLKRIEK